MMALIKKWIRLILLPRGSKALKAVIDTLCAGDTDLLSKISMDDIETKTRAFITCLPFRFFLAFKLTLLMVEYGLPPISRKLRRLSRMSLDQRLKYFDRLENNRFHFKRKMLKLLRTVCLYQIYSEKELLIALGYEKSLQSRTRKIAHPFDQLKLADRLIDSSTLKSDVTLKFDAVVVGSGAGGAVVAKELAEGGMKVALIEEGRLHRAHNDLASQAIGRLYRDMGMGITFGSPTIAVPTGKCLGGTTVINSGTCFRLPEAVLKKWQIECGLREINAPQLQRAFDRIEREIHVEDSRFDVMSRSNTLFHELTQRQGIHGAPLKRNILECEGCGMCCYGCSSGAKQAMDVSYLPKAIKAGATAYTRAKVQEIMIEPKTRTVLGIVAHAVDDRSQLSGHKIKILADRTIIACGTLVTPQLLRMNRIAAGNGHIGRHLTIHPAGKVYAEFEEEINGWEGTPQAYYLDTLKDEGIMFEGIFMPPDIATLSLPFGGKRMVDFMKRYRHMTTFGFMITDSTEGWMFRAPFLGYQFRYSFAQRDADRFKRATAYLARIFLKGGATRVLPLLHTKYWELRTKGHIEQFESSQVIPSDIETMAFHPLGTCRMAVSADRGVCDQNYQVFGHPQLYLCDGSIIPTPLGVNPQITIMAMATRCAELMLGKALI